MRGVIVTYFTKQMYGFIRPDSGEADVFFRWISVEEDYLGRRRPEVGIPAEFEIGSDGRASIVRLLREDEEIVDLENYREESVITRWIGDQGLARRLDSGAVFVHAENIITEGAPAVGVHLWHGVRPPDLGQKFWNAVDVEIFLPQSQIDSIFSEAEVCARKCQAHRAKRRYFSQESDLIARSQ